MRGFVTEISVSLSPNIDGLWSFIKIAKLVYLLEGTVFKSWSAEGSFFFPFTKDLHVDAEWQRAPGTLSKDLTGGYSFCRCQKGTKCQKWLYGLLL